MPEAEIKVDTIKSKVSDLEKALNEASRKGGIIPADCQWGCRIEIGPDGQPKLVCGIQC